jgi:hypothetical protein
MKLDWLFGPRLTEQGAHSYRLRSLTLEPDTLSEIRDLLDVECAQLEVTHNTSEHAMLGVPRPFDLDALHTAPDWHRRNITITGWEHVGPEGNRVSVVLPFEQPARVEIGDPHEPAASRQTVSGNTTWADLSRDVAVKLANEGRSRLRWRHSTHFLPWLGWLALAGSGVWTLMSERPPMSGAVFGALVVLALLVPARQLSRALSDRYVHSYPGNRIRTMSRAAIRQQRADRHANLKLAAVTLPVGAALGALGTVLTK